MQFTSIIQSGFRNIGLAFRGARKTKIVNSVLIVRRFPCQEIDFYLKSICVDSKW